MMVAGMNAARQNVKINASAVFNVNIIAYKNYASNRRRALYFASVQMKTNARK